MLARLSVAVLSLALVSSVDAQERLVPAPSDVLELEATVTSDVAPDLAVITLAITREGAEVAPLTKEVNEAMARAFADAKSVPGVIVSNGGYNTSPRYDSRGPGSGVQSVRSGWTVRAEIVLKSKDFDALGALVGRLSQNLQIVRSGFEVSADVRDRESAALLERGARAFAERAAAATRAFGYAGYTIRQVNVGGAGGLGVSYQASMLRVAAPAAASAAPLPIESGQVTLNLTVRGSVQMRK